MTELLDTTTEAQTVVTLAPGDFVVCYDWHCREWEPQRDKRYIGQVVEVSVDSFGTWWLTIATRDKYGNGFINIADSVWNEFIQRGQPLVTHVQRGTIAGRRVWQKF